MSEYSAGARWVNRHLASVCMSFSLFSIGFGSVAVAQQVDQAMIQKEVSRRAENLVLAQELLRSGDAHYNKYEFKEAVADYSKAFGLAPFAGQTAETRFAAADRYAQAAVEHGRELAKAGKYDEARSLMDKVLAEDVALGHKGAMTLRAQLDDPIRYNPVLTPEHIQNIETVAHWLRKAQGNYDLGKYDDAVACYEEVLRIDRYNVAARRGMESVNQQVAIYNEASRGTSRAQMLMEVDAAWSNSLKLHEMVSPEAGDNVVEGARMQEVQANKLKQMLVPHLEMRDLAIDEAIEQLRALSKKYDTTELDPAKKGVNFVLNIGARDSEWGAKTRKQRINLDLHNTPMDKVLDYICDATGTQWRHSEYSVVITPLGTTDGALYTRSFRVPPNFMADAAAAGAGEDDPFKDGESSSSSIQKRISAQDFLKQLGLGFPEGATARYVQGSNTLMVRNTANNLDLVEDYIRTISQKESVQVILRVTIIDVAQNDLEELGFDWLIGQGNIGGDTFLGGGTVGSGGGNVEALDDTLSPAVDPVTNGLRSGDSMFTSNALDRAILGSVSRSDVQQRGASPLAVRGELNRVRVEAILRALDQKKGVDTLQTPAVITRPGEKAHFSSVREFIYPTEYEPPEIPNNVGGGGGSFPVTPAMPTAFEMREVGVLLDAEATVSQDMRYIDLHLEPSMVSLDGFLNYGSPIRSIVMDPDSGEPIPFTMTENAILMPLFKKTGLNTNVTIQDGCTIVLGGLKQQSIEKVEDKVPVLGDMPFVGRLFRTEGLLNRKRAIIIFVNAELVDPTGRPWRDR